jgi:tetratricopeptide (TPR) repeat protein
MNRITARINKIIAWIQQNWEFYGLKLTPWLVVICSFIAIITKAFIGRPSSVPFHYLLIIAMIGAALATLLPKFEEYFSKINQIDFAGIKLILVEAKKIDFEIIKPNSLEEILPDSIKPGDTLDYPFPILKLKGYQKYEYERLSHKLYQTFDEIKDPNEVPANLKENYRDLIKYVGKMAFAMEHYTKYFQMISQLTKFKDRELSSDEMYEIGNAYLWAADDRLKSTEQEKYRKEAASFLTSAAKKSPDNARFAFGLGVCLLYLGNHQQGIRYMQKSIALYSAIVPWAKWNIACSLTEQGKYQEALKVLKEIPFGAWWKGILEDPGFANCNNSHFETSFKALGERKLNKIPEPLGPYYDYIMMFSSNP